MKTFKDYLIDFDSLNIGDKFYDSLFNEIVKTKMVREIGKFFVVEKPKSKEDTTEDIVFESTTSNLISKISHS